MNTKSKNNLHYFVMLFTGILGFLSLVFPAIDDNTWFGDIKIWLLGFTNGGSDDFMGDIFLMGLIILIISILLFVFGIQGIQKKIKRKTEKLLSVIEIIAGIVVLITVFYFNSYMDDNFYGNFDTGLGLICAYINVALLLVTGIVMLIIEQT